MNKIHKSFFRELIDKLKDMFSPHEDTSPEIVFATRLDKAEAQVKTEITRFGHIDAYKLNLIINHNRLNIKDTHDLITKYKDKIK